MELINDPILITLIEEDYLHTLSLYRWNISLNNHYQDDQIFSQIQSSTITIAPTDSTRQNGSTVIDYLSLAKSRKKSRRKARIQSSTFIQIPNTIDAECQTDDDPDQSKTNNSQLTNIKVKDYRQTSNKNSVVGKEEIFLSTRECVVCLIEQSEEEFSSISSEKCEHQYRDEYDRLNSSMDKSSLRWIRRNTKKCPQCRSNIEKNGGCDHIHCAKCGHRFYWRLATGNLPLFNNRLVNRRNKFGTAFEKVASLARRFKFSRY